MLKYTCISHCIYTLFTSLEKSRDICNLDFANKWLYVNCIYTAGIILCRWLFTDMCKGVLI